MCHSSLCKKTVADLREKPHYGPFNGHCYYLHSMEKMTYTHLQKDVWKILDEMLLLQEMDTEKGMCVYMCVCV